MRRRFIWLRLWRPRPIPAGHDPAIVSVADQRLRRTNWSQANYVAMVTGQFTKCQQQDRGIECHQDVDNLYHQLDVAGRTWKVWLEAGTARCDFGGHHCTSDTPCPLTGFYTTGNPPILFDNIEGPDGVWSPTTPSEECLANDVPAGTNDDRIERSTPRWPRATSRPSTRSSRTAATTARPTARPSTTATRSSTISWRSRSR